MRLRTTNTIYVANRRRGVSLIEVLATLVMVGIVLPAAMMGVTLSLRAAHLARHQQEASLLAESRLNEILALRDPAAYAGSGDFAPDWPEYRWQVETFVADFEMTEVAVTVTWMERGRERGVTLSSYLYLPTEDDSGTLDTSASAQ